MTKYNVVAPDGKILNTQPVARWCAERMVQEYMREFGWTTTIKEVTK
jgi:hypothetical protein